MINLPLPCKILLKSTTEVKPNISLYAAGTVQNVEGISPNLLAETITLEYPMLTINELALIEQAFDNSKGVERILWSDKRWVIDGYESAYYPQYALKVTLSKVG